MSVLAYYDRVMVMDEGKIAEFDTVLNLFDTKDSIFRSLCDEANLQRADILRIRAEHNTLVTVPQTEWTRRFHVYIHAAYWLSKKNS